MPSTVHLNSALPGLSVADASGRPDPCAAPAPASPLTLEGFLRRLWGEREGYAFIARGINGAFTSGRYTHKLWREHSFHWPRQAGELLAFVTAPAAPGVRVDWYCTPALF